jgi:hypothetical protein
VTEQTIALHLPEDLYQRLQRLSELTHRPLESLVLQTLDANLPSLPEDLSPAMREDLLVLEALDSEALWKVAKSMIAPGDQEQYSDLLEKNRLGTLTAPEQDLLEVLYQEANRKMLRKAYAYILLKWRGYPLPTLAELEAEN